MDVVPFPQKPFRPTPDATDEIFSAFTRLFRDLTAQTERAARIEDPASSVVIRAEIAAAVAHLLNANMTLITYIVTRDEG